MNTAFEIVAESDDPENAQAAMEAALDEVLRVDRLLSRFDPRSEISRINRTAYQRPVRVDYELLSILLLCRNFWESTQGHFDIAAVARTAGGSRPAAGSLRDVEIDADRHLVRFGCPDLALDLGGFGKGYALDRAGDVLKEYGVDRALLHGGTSSVLALGQPESAVGWQVGLRDPWTASEVGSVLLCDQALGSSAVFGSGQRTASDLIHPLKSAPLQTQAACTVLAPTATEAEILSTAFLIMGEDAMREHLVAAGRPFCAGWMDDPAANSFRWHPLFS